MIELTGDWELAERILAASPAAVNKACRQAVHQEAVHFEGLVIKHLSAGPPPTLSPWTVKMRKSRGGGGGDKPLNATGDMLGSVSVTPNTTASTEKWIGIPRSASAHGGQVVRLAEVHEFGATFVLWITPKMRRFLFGVLLKDEPKIQGPRKAGTSGKRYLVIHIPARPFIVPAFEEGAQQAQKRFEARIFKLLEPTMSGGGSGTP